MRRLFAILLIATSGWLLHQAASHHLSSATSFGRALQDPHFLTPAAGGLLGLIGGLVVMFNGPLGAGIAMIGGLGVAGVGMAVKQTFDLANIFDNEMAVGVTLLMLAGVAATTSRG